MSNLKKLLIICWYGEFPNYFQLFLDSCARNDGWNWLIFTDTATENFRVPQNVQFEKIPFADLTNDFEKKLEIGFKIAKPYKLCDFKPLYGYLFSDWVKGYDYWGHCDLDVIWGRLSHFFPDELICHYDRFLSQGHLTLYRNTQENNAIFKNKISRFVDYRVILKSPRSWGFDETGRYSISTILRRLPAYKYYTEKSAIADITPFGGFGIFEGGYKSIAFIRVKDGKLLVDFSGTQGQKEFAYVHLQKRKILKVSVNNPNDYFVFGNTIQDVYDKDEKEIILKAPSKFVLRKSQALRFFDILKFYLWKK